MAGERRLRRPLAVKIDQSRGDTDALLPQRINAHLSTLAASSRSQSQRLEDAVHARCHGRIHNQGAAPFTLRFTGPFVGRIHAQFRCIIHRLLPGAPQRCMGSILATAFHPELTADIRWHQLFLDMVSGQYRNPAPA